jgi:DNA-binding transcriptional LysR family regulator
MLDQLRAMAVFQAVAESGNFRAAAKKLSLSPSVVSHHITQLESSLGIALLYRTTRKVSLTDAGRELLRSTQEMSDAANRGLTAMRLRADQPVGTLKITCPTAMDRPPYANAITEFSRTYPRVNLKMNFTMRNVELAGSDFDLALRGSPFGLPDSSYISKKLFDIHSIYVTTPAYANARGRPVRFTDCLTWDRIQFPPSSQANIYAFTGLDRSIAIPDARFECDSPQAAREFILAGLGWGLMDYYLVRKDLEAGRLIQILPDAPVPTITFYALWPANAGNESLARRFVDFVAPRWAKLDV